MADEEQEETGEESKGGKKNIIMFAILGVVLIGLSVGGTMLAMKMLAPPAEAPVASEAAGSASESVTPESKSPAIYYPLKPALRTNIPHRGRFRLVELEVSLMTRDIAVVEAIESHKATLNNDLLMLVLEQTFDELLTAEGKELLRQQALEKVRSILEAEAGVTGVEQVLFTEFKMQ